MPSGLLVVEPPLLLVTTTSPSQPMRAVCSTSKLTTSPSQPMRAVFSLSKFADQTKPIQRLVHHGLVGRLQSTIHSWTAPDA